MQTVIHGDAVRRALTSIRQTFLAEVEEERSSEDPREEMLTERAEVFQLHFKVVLDIFLLVKDTEEKYRDAITFAKKEFDPQIDQAVQNLYTLWLEIADNFRQRAEFYTRHGVRINNTLTQNLKLFTADAKQSYSAWTAPKLTRFKPLRVRAVTPQLATVLGVKPK